MVPLTFDLYSVCFLFAVLVNSPSCLSVILANGCLHTFSQTWSLNKSQQVSLILKAEKAFSNDFKSFLEAC